MSTWQGRRGVSRKDISQYKSALPQADSIFNPLYDYQTYPLAGQQTFTFFSVPQGQGTTSAFGGAGPKTVLDTNLQTGGALPLGNRFLVYGIEVEFFPGNVPGFNAAATMTAAQFARNWDDVYSVLRNGALTFNIQNRYFAQDAPLMKFPTQTRLAGVASYSETAAGATSGQIEYAAGCGASYSIIPVYIESTQAFNCVVNFPALIALPSGADGRIGVRLVGKMVRNAQ